MPARWGWLMGLSLCATGVALAADEELPPLELLEFLGGFETAAGEWVDPTELEVLAPSARAGAEVETGGQKE